MKSVSDFIGITPKLTRGPFTGRRVEHLVGPIASADAQVFHQ